MFMSEKEQEVLNFIAQSNASTNVKTIAKELFLSEPTIRRYLTSLAEKNLIIRTHGGAMINYDNAMFTKNVPLYLRISSMSDEKRKIARNASTLLFHGATVFLDGSSTAFHLLPHFSTYKDLLIITNNLKTAITAAEMKLKTICLGGEVNNTSLSCNSQETINIIRKFNVDLLFFSCDALSDDGLLTDKSKIVSHIREEFMKRAKTKVLMIDNTKLNKKEWYTLCELSDIDYCFCNTPLPDHLANMLKKSEQE